jgi:hypothetical protein
VPRCCGVTGKFVAPAGATHNTVPASTRAQAMLAVCQTRGVERVLRVMNWVSQRIVRKRQVSTRRFVVNGRTREGASEFGENPQSVSQILPPMP